jgi:hypothetical protein
MRLLLIVVGALVIASAGVIVPRFQPSVAMAQGNQAVDRSYELTTGKTATTLRVGRGEQQGNATILRDVTLTIGDVIITVDDMTLESGEIKLGANGRIKLPPQ